jgi:hypothetical protein
MADRIPPLRIVRESDGSPAASRRRTPGAAVVLILVYAVLFGAGLWWFRSASPLFRARGRKPDAAGSASDAARRPDPAPKPEDGIARRAALLAGEGLPESARVEYERRIGSERCTCGCELTLQACLARDRACGRSPEIAEKIRASLR